LAGIFAALGGVARLAAPLPRTVLHFMIHNKE